jgi:alkylation response protein AidB-like acyl-CoA dehydrogenase
MGWKSQPTAVVNLEDVRVPQENLLGKEVRAPYRFIATVCLEMGKDRHPVSRRMG